MPSKNHISKIAGAIAVLLLLSVGVYIYTAKPNGNENGAGENGPVQPEKRLVQLYFYNENEDRRLSGGDSLLCSRDAVLPVERYLDRTNAPIQDTLRLLLSGGLTQEERDAGFDTEFPLEGLSLVGANLREGVLTLEFFDPQNKTVGGSCRVNILWAQIEKTAKQFAEVAEVRFIPEELFQP